MFPSSSPFWSGDTRPKQCLRAELGPSLEMTICAEYGEPDGSEASCTFSFKRKLVVQEGGAEGGTECDAKLKRDKQGREEPHLQEPWNDSVSWDGH